MYLRFQFLITFLVILFLSEIGVAAPPAKPSSVQALAPPKQPAKAAAPSAPKSSSEPAKQNPKATTTSTTKASPTTSTALKDQDKKLSTSKNADNKAQAASKDPSKQVADQKAGQKPSTTKTSTAAPVQQSSGNKPPSVASTSGTKQGPQTSDLKRTGSGQSTAAQAQSGKKPGTAASVPDSKSAPPATGSKKSTSDKADQIPKKATDNTAGRKPGQGVTGKPPASEKASGTAESAKVAKANPKESPAKPPTTARTVDSKSPKPGQASGFKDATGGKSTVNDGTKETGNGKTTTGAQSKNSASGQAQGSVPKAGPANSRPNGPNSVKSTDSAKVDAQEKKGYAKQLPVQKTTTAGATVKAERPIPETGNSKQSTSTTRKSSSSQAGPSRQAPEAESSQRKGSQKPQDKSGSSAAKHSKDNEQGRIKNNGNHQTQTSQAKGRVSTTDKVGSSNTGGRPTTNGGNSVSSKGTAQETAARSKEGKASKLPKLGQSAPSAPSHRQLDEEGSKLSASAARKDRQTTPTKADKATEQKPKTPGNERGQKQTGSNPGQLKQTTRVDGSQRAQEPRKQYGSYADAVKNKSPAEQKPVPKAERGKPTKQDPSSSSGERDNARQPSTNTEASKQTAKAKEEKQSEEPAKKYSSYASAVKGEQSAQEKLGTKEKPSGEKEKSPPVKDKPATNKEKSSTEKEQGTRKCKRTIGGECWTDGAFREAKDAAGTKNSEKFDWYHEKVQHETPKEYDKEDMLKELEKKRVELQQSHQARVEEYKKNPNDPKFGGSRPQMPKNIAAVYRKDKDGNTSYRFSSSGTARDNHPNVIESEKSKEEAKKKKEAEKAASGEGEAAIAGPSSKKGKEVAKADASTEAVGKTDGKSPSASQNDGTAASGSKDKKEKDYKTPTEYPNYGAGTDGTVAHPVFLNNPSSTGTPHSEHVAYYETAHEEGQADWTGGHVLSMNPADGNLRPACGPSCRGNTYAHGVQDDFYGWEKSRQRIQELQLGNSRFAEHDGLDRKPKVPTKKQADNFRTRGKKVFNGEQDPEEARKAKAKQRKEAKEKAKAEKQSPEEALSGAIDDLEKLSLGTRSVVVRARAPRAQDTRMELQRALRRWLSAYEQEQRKTALRRRALENGWFEREGSLFAREMGFETHMARMDGIVGA